MINKLKIVGTAAGDWELDVKTKTITMSEFIDGARDEVLLALDAYMEKLTGSDNAMGARDQDLPKLFAGLDEHMRRVAARYNDPESTEVGSAYLTILEGD